MKQQSRKGMRKKISLLAKPSTLKIIIIIIMNAKLASRQDRTRLQNRQN